jgi:hypothetical protein
MRRREKVPLPPGFSLYVFNQGDAVTHEVKFEYKKWGIWFVECECGERFTSTTLATAVEKHEQHSFTRSLQSKVKEDNDVRSKP